MSEWRRGRFAAAAGLVLALVGAAFLAVSLATGWDEVRRRLDDVILWPIAISVLLNLVQSVVAAALWRDLAGSLGVTINFRESYRLVYLAALGKYIPGRVWVLASTASLATAAGIPAGAAATAMALMSLAIGLVGIALGGLLYLHASADLPLWSAAVGLAAAMGLTWLAAHWTPPRPAALLRAGSRALLCWALVGLSQLATAHALAPLPLEALPRLLSTAALAWIVGQMAVAVPAGLGAREAAQTLLLAGTMPPATAAAFTLLVRVGLVAGDAAATAIALLIRPLPAASTHAPLHRH